ncbi:MAG: electron transfer flavoprotein subunit alpha/FixB family protein [Bacteroidia bacterium]|nr:electron transfer flavoprotein subunit alpha/FixB family protein [Bacteroidia bacterium]
MSILVFSDASNSKLKKSILESVYFAKQIASKNNSKVLVLLYKGNDESKQQLTQAGADKIINITNEVQGMADFSVTARLIKKYVLSENIKDVVLPFDLQGRAVSSYLAGLLNCGIVSGVIQLTDISNDVYKFKKNVFSGKAIATISISGDKKIITLLPNSIQIQLNSAHSSEVIDIEEKDTFPTKIKIKSVEKNTTAGNIPLPEAELVVSGGRGLKGPENWGIIEDLAKALGAATACSRPVADSHWRPHHEHVGQTGLTIRPNLYIAIGISGAIQHLAGVSGSKTIVVINTDKDAPFFKAADYGIVGDAFEVVPKLTEAIKKFKETHHQ